MNKLQHQTDYDAWLESPYQEIDLLDEDNPNVDY